MDYNEDWFSRSTFHEKAQKFRIIKPNKIHSNCSNHTDIIEHIKHFSGFLKEPLLQGIVRALSILWKFYPSNVYLSAGKSPQLYNQ